MKTLKIYKTHTNIKLPSFATEHAACFDIAAQFAGKISYKGYNKENAEFEREIHKGIVLVAGDRVIVPTGLVFDIPEGHSVRIHPRSGLSLKQGLVLANLEAIIDSDYYHETMILLTNTSANKVIINDGDRVAQGELVKSLSYQIVETETAPTQKTTRSGGLGSTGVTTNA